MPQSVQVMLSDAFGAFNDAMVLAALDTVDFLSSMEATEARALSSFSSSGKELMVARWEGRGEDLIEASVRRIVIYLTGSV